MKKVGTQVELDLSSMLKEFDAAYVAVVHQGKAWQEWDAVVKRTFPTLKQAQTALKQTVGRLDELRHTQEGSTEAGKAEINIRRAQVKSLRRVITAYKETDKELETLAKAEIKRAAEIQAAWATRTAEIKKDLERKQKATSEAAKKTAQVEKEAADEVAKANEKAAQAAEKAANQAEKAHAKKGEAVKRAAKEEEAAAKKAQRAQERYTKAIGRSVKKMALWAIGSASAYRMFMKLRRAVEEAIREVYGHTEEMKNLTTAWDDFTHAVVLSLAPYDEILSLMDHMAELLNDVSGGLLGASAKWDGYTAAANAAAGETGYLSGLLQGAVTNLEAFPVAGIAMQQFLGGLAVGAASMGILSDETAELVLNVYDLASAEREAMNAAAMAAAKTEDYSKQVQNMITLSQAWTDATTKHNVAAREITQTYLTNVKVIQAQYYDKLYKADVRYNKAVDKINADALDAREDVWAGYYKKIESLRRAIRKRERNDAERHALEMMFARRRFDLTMLQNERMYQYQRGLLIGEGDVLAIEDLDARYELEQQAQEENFALQMEQAEAMYQLQARYQREANREQIALLRDALNEQLQEIEEARREQLAEAEAAHTEERSEAAAWAGEQMADELKNQQDQLTANDKYLEKMRRKTAEGLAKIAKEHDLAWNDVYGVWSSAVGPDSTIDKLGKDFHTRQVALAKSFGDAWIRQINLIRQAAAAGIYLPVITRGLPSAGGPPRGHPQHRQYGGDDIVSSPTMFMAGERGQPERVIVQPLSPIGGGALTLGWQGGAIPVHGTGQLEGMDLSGLGDAISQGLVSSMRRVVLSYRGTRGS